MGMGLSSTVLKRNESRYVGQRESMEVFIQQEIHLLSAYPRRRQSARVDIAFLEPWYSIMTLMKQRRKETVEAKDRPDVEHTTKPATPDIEQTPKPLDTVKS